MKLETIIELDKRIEQLKNISQILKDCFIKELDDELWTIDMEVIPEWGAGNDYHIRFIAIKPLKKKFIIHFCEEHGLSLNYYQEVEEGFLYVFELEDDIIGAIEQFNL